MFSSNKMMKLSELFDLLTLSVEYDVNNCLLKTFTYARNDFLNVRKSPKKLSSDLLESLSIAFTLSVTLFSFTLSLTSFSFIISRWYSLLLYFQYQQFHCFLCSTGILLAMTCKFFFRVHLVSHIVFHEVPMHLV